MIAKRVQRVGFSPTLRINALATRMRAEGKDVLDFSAGQPDFPTPDSVKLAGKQAIDDNKTRYTPNAGVPELRGAIATSLSRDCGLTYEPEQILVSPGAKASLYFAAMALFDPGDEVLVPSPYWVSYPEQIRLADAEPRFVDCREENGFKLNPQDLENAVTERTKAVLLNYPSNPTGACYNRTELEALADVCERKNIWIIADEIYSKLIYDGATFTSIAGLNPESRARTVVINGVSKSYSMTGWRIGYAAGPVEVIKAMGTIQSHSTSNATSISQWASVDALTMPQEKINSRVEEFERRRDEIVGLLQALPGVTCRKPEGAFYVFPNVSGCFGRGETPVTSGEELCQLLLETASVAVVPGEAFGSPNHLRFSYSVSLDRIREGLERVERVMTRLA
jgi:aspartate/methionine/tyrosine aminotransferase